MTWEKVDPEEARRVMENADWALAIQSYELKPQPLPDGAGAIFMRLTIARAPNDKSEVPRTEKLLLAPAFALQLARDLENAARGLS